MEAWYIFSYQFTNSYNVGTPLSLAKDCFSSRWGDQFGVKEQELSNKRSFVVVVVVAVRFWCLNGSVVINEGVESIIFLKWHWSFLFSTIWIILADLFVLTMCKNGAVYFQMPSGVKLLFGLLIFQIYFPNLIHDIPSSATMELNSFQEEEKKFSSLKFATTLKL